MSITDQKILKESQYKNSDKLTARIRLHKKYGTNPYPWHRWIFDHLDMIPGMRILELGCGPADFWIENGSLIPINISVILADLSIGMLSEASDRLGNKSTFFAVNADAQFIPIPDRTCEIVIANHMLYHVPDIQAAMREIVRVLRPEGLFCAATNGPAHMRELHELIAKFTQDQQIPMAQIKRFDLENGTEILTQHFGNVERKVFESHLKVTDPSDLIAYIKSMWPPSYSIVDAALAKMGAETKEQIRRNGEFHITKSQGLFLARLK